MSSFRRYRDRLFQTKCAATWKLRPPRTPMPTSDKPTGDNEGDRCDTDAIVERRVDSAGELAALSSPRRSVARCLAASQILVRDVAVVVDLTARSRHVRPRIGASVYQPTNPPTSHTRPVAYTAFQFLWGINLTTF